MFVSLTALTCAVNAQQEEQIPLVYDVENTGAEYADPVLPAFEELPEVQPLTDPFEWADGSGRSTDFKDWSKRRAEIAKEIQHYEIGTKPTVDPSCISARMDGNTLTVDVTVNGETLTLTSEITYPSTGEAPYALMIGTSGISLPKAVFDGKPIATMTFRESQVNSYSQMGGSTDRESYNFVRLYPELIDNGAYSEWAWGLSRLIDGLQQLGPEVTKIDTKRIGVTGCSYAGKMALFCGAFDERIALTIAQEPGGGGAAAWRVSHNLEGVECLDNTDYNWFMQSLKENFAGDNVYRLPYDHHELCAMVCPRALLMLGNPDYQWLADPSGYVSMNAARKVWDEFGIADRVGYSIVAGHGHCQLPESQYPEVEAFIDKFLLGDESANTDDVTIAPDYEETVDLSIWMDWWGQGEPPTLPGETVYLETYKFEAEDLMTAANETGFKRVDDETCQGGAYVETTVNNTTLPDDPGCTLTAEFNAEHEGKFYIYALVNAPSYANDAYFISFDDNTPSRCNGLNTKGQWMWRNLTRYIDDGTLGTFANTLQPGPHKVNITGKEIGVKLDMICVSTSEELPEGLPTSIDAAEGFGGYNISAARGNGGGVEATITVPADGNVSLTLFNMSGQKVGETDSMPLAAGEHTLTVGANVDKGVYVLNLKTAEMSISKTFAIK